MLCVTLVVGIDTCQCRCVTVKLYKLSLMLSGNMKVRNIFILDYNIIKMLCKVKHVFFFSQYILNCCFSTGENYLLKIVELEVHILYMQRTV